MSRPTEYGGESDHRGSRSTKRLRRSNIVSTSITNSVSSGCHYFAKRNIRLLITSGPNEVCTPLWDVNVTGRPLEAQQDEDTSLHAVLPPNTKGFEAFYPRDAYGIPNGSVRPAHGHGSFYQFRNPALIDAKNSPAYGYRFDGGRRFNYE